MKDRYLDDPQVRGKPASQLPYFLVIVVAVIAIVGMWKFFHALQKSVSVPATATKAAQEAHTKAVLEYCNVHTVQCFGGFAKYTDTKKSPRIVRLYYPNAKNPEVLGVTAAATYYKQDSTYANQFEWIVLPDDPKWKEYALEFDRQFLWNSHG